MFAVIKTGSVQYRVVPNDVLEMQHIPGEVGQIVQFDQVLMLGGESPVLGLPTVSGASVAAEVLEQRRGPKVISFKKRRRKNSRSKRGYREKITVLRITEILADNAKPTIAPRQKAKTTATAATARPDVEQATPASARSPFPGYANDIFRKIRESVSPALSSSDTRSGAGTDAPRSRDIVADLRNPSPDRRVAALVEAAEIVREFDRSKEMDKSERLRRATLPRRMYAKLFDSDEHVARQAAYSLVISSKSFGHGRKAGDIDKLARKEIDGVRHDLQRLLPKLGQRYFSYVDLKGFEKTDAFLDASVRIRVSRALPFKMNDEPVIVEGALDPAADDASFSVMSVSSADTIVKRRYRPGDKEWRKGDLFLVDCKVRLPLRKGQVVKALPIAFEVDGLGSAKRELQIDAKSAHLAA